MSLWDNMLELLQACFFFILAAIWMKLAQKAMSGNQVNVWILQEEEDEPDGFKSPRNRGRPGYLPKNIIFKNIRNFIDGFDGNQRK